MPDPAQLDAARDLIAFSDASPSPFHACATAAERLDAAGFARVDEAGAWPADQPAQYFVRDGSLVAWRIPDGASPTTPFRIIGAHTDSPNLRVKPNPDLQRAGTHLVGVEVYGGPLFNSWLDRDLGLSGRVALRGGEVKLLRVDRPIARIPQLAIHLDRDVNSSGLTLNPQQHLSPVWAIDDGRGFAAFVAAELDVAEADVVFCDLMFHDVTPGALVGRELEFVSAARLDNLCSCWAAVEALLCAPDASAVSVVALFDHEEVGSNSDRGASSPVLESTLERITLGLGGGRDDWRRALAASICLSADMAHATHPNYAERHDTNHWIQLNGGPVVKTNVSQRYATDARSAGPFVAACAAAGVPVQYYVNRNDLPCGSTIGPITAARLGITTVDVGAPQLAMHSAREMMGSTDVDLYRRALGAFLSAG